MTRHPLIARLRGRDGRSIAQALSAILLLVTFLAGFNAGAMAAAAPQFSICATGSPDHGTLPGHPGGHVPDCCLTGHGPATMALPPTGLAALLDRPRGGVVAVLSPRHLPARPIITGASPRGPPFLA